MIGNFSIKGILLSSDCFPPVLSTVLLCIVSIVLLVLTIRAYQKDMDYGVFTGFCFVFLILFILQLYLNLFGMLYAIFFFLYAYGIWVSFMDTKKLIRYKENREELLRKKYTPFYDLFYFDWTHNIYNLSYSEEEERNDLRNNLEEVLRKHYPDKEAFSLRMQKEEEWTIERQLIAEFDKNNMPLWDLAGMALRTGAIVLALIVYYIQEYLNGSRGRGILMVLVTGVVLLFCHIIICGFITKRAEESTNI